MTVAVIEIGSGSVKLVVCESDSGLTKEHHVAEVNLGLDLAQTGSVDKVALDGLRATLRQFKALADTHQVDRIVAVGTETAGLTKHSEQLTQVVFDELEVDLTVVDSDRAATATVAGALVGRDLPTPATMIDIGLAATDFAVVDDDGVRVMSIPIGGQTIFDQFIESDPPKPEELSAALSVIELHLEDLRRGLQGFGTAISQGCPVLSPGALNEVAAVELGLLEERSLDGFLLEREAAEDVFRTLATESREDRAFNPGLRPNHVDDVVGTLCILVEFIRQFGVEEIVVSEKGLLHGLAFEMLNKE